MNENKDSVTIAGRRWTRQQVRENPLEFIGLTVTFECERPGCSNERTENISHYLRRVRHYCSPECVQLDTRKFEVPAEILSQLVWMVPTTTVAEVFNVSDKAIHKRCKRLGINKPPRGYWTVNMSVPWSHLGAFLKQEGIDCGLT